MKKYILKFLSRVGIRRKITREKLDKFLDKHRSTETALDIGGRGSYAKKYFPNSKILDIVQESDVDFVADAHDLGMFQDGEFELVLCIEALEHMYAPQVVIDGIFRILKPGGKLILTTRFIFPIHDAPHDYFRFTKYGLKHLLRDFEEVKIEEEAPTNSTFAILIQRLGYQTQTLHMNFLKFFWLILARIINKFNFLITKEWGDIGRDKVENQMMTSGYYVVAVKPKKI